MKVKEKLMLDMEGLKAHGPINIVILGDSVSHGALRDGIDFEGVYWNRLRKMLNAYRTYVPVNMICTAIGATSARDAIPRLERQVLCHEADLVIVCFGLNDVNGSLENFLSHLSEIFARCLAAGSDVIYMTPNMLNTYVAEDTAEHLKEYAKKTAEMQNSGKMDAFMEGAAALARRMGVRVCDCYALWKELSRTEDTTLLLANRINHPTSEMHALFAESLYAIIMEEAETPQEADSTMYREARGEGEA